MRRNAERLLAALDAAGHPVAVSDLARAMEGACDLATVYRALRRMEASGVVESFAFECSSRGIERYWQRRGSPHRHFFHCESCHRFVDIGACGLAPLQSRVERELGARVQAHTLYFTGTCADCRDAAPAPRARRA